MQGLKTARSSFSPKETMDRFEAQVRTKGMHVFCRIDHAAGAREVGLELGPAELLIFGNPRAGTLLMQLNPTSGIDLPLKALVWRDASQDTWLSYNEPEWIARRHDLSGDADATVGAMAAALAALCKAATEAA
jgi:uncharacterized protein (DUF302 family)